MNHLHSVPLERVGDMPRLFLDYLKQPYNVSEFFHLYPNIENFDGAIKARMAYTVDRAVLTNALWQQYKCINHLSDAVAHNISSLANENTFTITTGHQICLFTGPLYFIYKIISAIQLCTALKAKYPQYHFVPVYWMATEDHDFAEINHFYLWGKKYEWTPGLTGAVGRMGTHSLKNFFEQLPERFPDFENAYLTQKNMADATRSLVNSLFGEYGLVVLDGDNAALKSQFKNEIKEELTQSVCYNNILATNQTLVQKGHQPQIQPREINLFYLSDGLRERIVKDDGIYTVLNTSLAFTENEILDILYKNPENFSPNVAMRPLYQEKILPNLAYVGGPGELTYWLQLKATFKAFDCYFPILFPRNFGLILPKKSVENWQKSGLNFDDLFLEEHDIKRKYLKNQPALFFDYKTYHARLEEIFSSIKTDLRKIDPSLEGFSEAQKIEATKILNNIEKKASKAAETKEQQTLQKIYNIKNKLFPQGNLQERHDNFLNFFSKNHVIIHNLFTCFNIWDFDFKILISDE